MYTTITKERILNIFSTKFNNQTTNLIEFVIKYMDEYKDIEASLPLDELISEHYQPYPIIESEIIKLNNTTLHLDIVY